MAHPATRLLVSGTRRGPTVAIGGLIVAVAIVASCGGGGGSHAATTSTTTTAPATTTTLVSADPQGSAVALYNAWKAGDRVAAGLVTNVIVVNKMFSVPYEPGSGSYGPVDPYAFNGCQGAAGSTFCAWQASGAGTITIRVNNMSGGVVDVQRGP